MRTDRKMSTVRLTRRAKAFSRGRRERQERRPLELLELHAREDVREEIEHEPRLDAHLLAKQEDVLELRQVSAIHREDDLVDGELREDLRKILKGAEKRDAVGSRRLAVLGGLLAQEAEELQPPPRMLADEAGHGRSPRRVPDEDDGAEIEAERPHAAGHETDRDALGHEEKDVHDEEDGEKRPRDEVPAGAEDDEGEQEASEERSAGHERDFVLEAQRAVAAICAFQEEEAREDQHGGSHEDEVPVEVVERRQPAEDVRQELASEHIRHGQRRERDAEVGRVQERGDRPGLLLQHSGTGASPPPRS